MIILSKESVILSYQLGKGGLPFIERQGALERVLREDSLKEEEFCFASKDGGTSYVHEYLWYPNANISVMRLGYVENYNYQYCIVVVSMDEMFPYIVVHDYQQVFKDAAEVEDTICYSLKKALGRCLECISISQCYDEEAIKWVIHGYEVYQSAVTDKKRLETKLTNYGKHKPNIKSNISRFWEFDRGIIRTPNFASIFCLYHRTFAPAFENSGYSRGLRRNAWNLIIENLDCLTIKIFRKCIRLKKKKCSTSGTTGQ